MSRAIWRRHVGSLDARKCRGCAVLASRGTRSLFLWKSGVAPRWTRLPLRAMSCETRCRPLDLISFDLPDALTDVPEALKPPGP